MYHIKSRWVHASGTILMARVVESSEIWNEILKLLIEIN